MVNLNNAKAIEYQKSHPDKTRSAQLKTRYGITLEDYLKLQDEQDNRCAICGGEPTMEGRKKRLSVDHCHTTGRVRGLLCTRCNTALGWFENHEIKIKEYLED